MPFVKHFTFLAVTKMPALFFVGAGAEKMGVGGE